MGKLYKFENVDAQIEFASPVKPQSQKKGTVFEEEYLFPPAAAFIAMVKEYQNLRKALGDMTLTVHPRYYTQIIEKSTD